VIMNFTWTQSRTSATDVIWSTIRCASSAITCSASSASGHT
jgi:hypothetical protein